MKVIFVLLCLTKFITVSDPVNSCSTDLVLEAAVEDYEEWQV